MPFNIIRSDITKVKADAVVNAANTSLLGDGGVDGAIHRAAGAELLEECRKLGGCETGQAKITKGYKMPCKYIIHTVGPIWRGGNNNESELLYSCYKNSMELAKKYKCKSIAFPLISSGAYGYPKRQALDIAEKAVRDFLSDNDMDITLVIFDKESFMLSGTFADEIKKYIDDNYAEEHYPEAEMQELAKLNYPTTAEYIPQKRFMFNKQKNSFASEKYFSRSNLEKDLLKKDMPFSEKLLKLIDKSGRKDSEVYKAANVGKQTFSQIRNEKKYHPRKNTVIAFAIALKLTLEETEELLKSAGYAFSSSDTADIIVTYCISHGQYDIFTINEILFEHDLTLLGSKSE